MLHLAIICIVCAAFAPSDSTAFNGQKKNESNILYNFEGVDQNVVKVSFPNVYNVVGRNSSDCAKPGITFFYDYFSKQYQNSKNNSCSIMERVPLGENKNLHSNINFVYRKRNLLWIADENGFQPKTLRPPISNRCTCSGRRPEEKTPDTEPRKKNKCRILKLFASKLNLLSRWKRRKARKKFGQADKESLMKAELKNLEMCTLSPKEKKMFLYLKRCGCNKNKKQKANLGMLQVDDDLDLNKRIKKLVEQLAAENQRKKERLEEMITSEGRESEIGHRNLKKEEELSPVLNNIKKMFVFNKNNVNNRIVDNIKTDPVSSMRVRYPKKAENVVSSYDFLRTKRKSIRLRRNPPKSHSNECSKNRGTKYKNNLCGWSNPYSANFKANVNFLYPQRSRKFFSENKKKRRWMKMRMRRNRQKKGLQNWPILKGTFEKLYTSDTKPAYRDRFVDSSRKPAPNRNRRSCMNITGTSQAFLKDEMVNCTPFQSINSDSKAHEQGESTTENAVGNIQLEFPFFTIEKPLLKRQPRDEKVTITKDTDKFATEGPSLNSVDFHEDSVLGGIKNRKNPLRCLKIRNILRDNIVRNKDEDPKKVNLLYRRKKRHGSKYSSSLNKNWKSASVFCIPYVREAHENQLQCLIKLIQNMMGKPIPLKSDTFEETSYKAGYGKRRNTPRDFGEGGKAKYPSGGPHPCNGPHLHSKLFQIFPFSRNALKSKVPYEPVKAGDSHKNVIDSSSTFSPKASPLGTTDSVQVHQPQTPISNSVTTWISNSFPFMQSGKIDDLSKNTPSPESYSSNANMPVIHSSQPSSGTFPGPTFSSSGKALVAWQASIPVPSSFPCIPTPPPLSPITCAYGFLRENNSPTQPVPEPPIASTSGWQIQHSAVNSYVLQESESQSENKGTSDTSTCKGEMCTTMISHFSEAPSQEPQNHQRVDQVGTREMCCAEENNPTVLRLAQQPNSESVDSQYHAPKSNAGFKGTEMHNSGYLSRVGQSKNEEKRRKVEMIQKLIGNAGREAAFHHKRFCHKCNSKSKSKGNKKWSGRLKHFKDRCKNLLRKFTIHDSKTKSRPVPKKNKGKCCKPKKGRKSSSKRPTEGKCPEINIDIPIYSTPVYMNTNYLPTYDDQNQEIIPQSSENSKQLKSEDILPMFGRFRLDGVPYIYALNPLLEQNENYVRKFTTKSPLLSYDVESQVQASLKRQKRSDDYYVWPEDDYSYGDYSFDLEEDSKSLSSPKPPPENWTPPSYDMFCELAKALAQTEKKEMSSTIKPLASSAHPKTINTTISTTTTIRTTENEQETEEPLITSSTTTTTTTTTTTVTTTITTTTTPPTTTTTTTTSTSTSSSTTITTSPTSAAGTTSTASCISGRLKSHYRGGKKSYERFSKHSGNSKNLVESRDDKEQQVEDFIPAEDVHSPTTLRAAAIVRGQKKFQGKPSPKVYMKVFPDSFEKNDQDAGEALVASTVRATEAVNTVKSPCPEQATVSLKSDLRLQILAVCEGYLEVVKLIKAQNQTLAEDTDESLARYCENIISQHFNFQSEKSEKSKKAEPNESLTPNTNKKDSEKETDSKVGPEFYEDLISLYDSTASPDGHFRDPSSADNSDDLISKRKSDRNLASKGGSLVKRRKRRRNIHRSSRQSPKLRRIRKKDAEEDLEASGIGKEQKELIRLLRERKKALLSWLLTANDGVKSDGLQETEYFDEEDLIEPESDTAQYSGTIKPRRDEQNCRTTQTNMRNLKDTYYPVYAKDYGYESGGELIEVEVLWRQVNEKTHENKIFKNLSVLALLLTSTPSPKIKPEETKLVGDESEIETETKWKKHKLPLDPAKVEADPEHSNTSSTNTRESTENCTSYSKVILKKIAKSKQKNQTHTIISKPDPSSIVGAPTCANKTQRKISHKYGVAKDIFQEYSIEFLNYAVYILPMMFTVLFLLCCLCCALQILKIQKGRKRRKKKKKKVVTSEETSDSCTCETESKKRKRESKRKRNPGSKENHDNVHKKKSKTFWNYLKVNNKPSREMDEENGQTEKKKSFLGFLKGKREDGKPGYSSAPTGETDDEHHTGDSGRKNYSDHYITIRTSDRELDKQRKEEQGEAAERRELIALLEELKKIETEHIEGKKEVKSVQVQYAFPEYDNSPFQPKSQVPELPYPYEKNVFGMPKGICPFYNKTFQFHPAIPPASGDYNFCDVNEMTKLLPWECYPPGSDFFKRCDIKIDRTGRCDRFLKIFRDSGMNCNLVEKNCKTSESESRSFIFNKYRSVNVDKSEELGGVRTKVRTGTEVRLMEKVSPCKLSSNRDEDLVEDVENLKCQLNKKKYVRLKDEGVLCRL